MHALSWEEPQGVDDVYNSGWKMPIPVMSFGFANVPPVVAAIARYGAGRRAALANEANIQFKILSI